MNATETSDEFVPATADELSQFLCENSVGEARAVYPAGGRTALHYGYSPTKPGISLSTLKLNRTIDYPARDMTITVESGIRMDELTAILKAEGQRLPVDAPQSQRATLGGVVATDTSGPRRFGFGTMRDYVIGIMAAGPSGKLFNAGGRVVKNVAGYDLCKLLTGSLGTLGVITQLTLKLKPLPETSTLLWCRFQDWQAVEAALEQMLSSATRPVAVEVLNAEAAHEVAAEARLDLPTDGPVLCVGFEGTETETVWQAEKFREEMQQAGATEVSGVDEPVAAALWFSLTDFATTAEEPLSFQANLRPSRTVEFIEKATAVGVEVGAHAGNGIVIGHLPDEVTTLEAAGEIIHPLREFATCSNGNLVILDCDPPWKDSLKVFGNPESGWPLMKKIKQQLDPRGIFNPGLFLDGE